MSLLRLIEHLESSSSYDNIDVSPTKPEHRNTTEKTRNQALLEEFISRRNDATAKKEDRIRVKPKPKPRSSLSQDSDGAREFSSPDKISPKVKFWIFILKETMSCLEVKRLR